MIHELCVVRTIWNGTGDMIHTLNAVFGGASVAASAVFAGRQHDKGLPPPRMTQSAEERYLLAGSRPRRLPD